MARKKTEGAGEQQLGAGPTKRGQRPALPISMELWAEIVEVARIVGMDTKTLAATLARHLERDLRGKVGSVYQAAVAAALNTTDPVG